MRRAGREPRDYRVRRRASRCLGPDSADDICAFGASTVMALLGVRVCVCCFWDWCIGIENEKNVAKSEMLSMVIDEHVCIKFRECTCRFAS